MKKLQLLFFSIYRVLLTIIQYFTSYFFVCIIRNPFQKVRLKNAKCPLNQSRNKKKIKSFIILKENYRQLVISFISYHK